MPKLVAIKKHISVQQLEQRYRYASCCNREKSLSCDLVISFPVASELILSEIRTRQCRFPTINPGRDTALPCPLYHSGAAGIDIIG